MRDRVVQAAVVLVLMPMFEADFHSLRFAYRPKRNAHQAMRQIKEGLRSGRIEVIDADLAGYSDGMPHARLLKLVARRVSDGRILAMIRAWLQAPIVEEDPKTGKRQVTPKMIRYAGDFVMLCRRGQGEGLLGRLRRWVEAPELKLNEKKTRLHQQQGLLRIVPWPRPKANC